MEYVDKNRELLSLFAQLLTYPQEKPLQAGKKLLALVRKDYPAQAVALADFAGFIEQSTLAHLQELFTATFDVQVVCYPYIGYQLFGESYKRGTFMVRLVEFYKNENFAVENELPDHLAVVLKFMSQTQDDELYGHLLKECIIPSLEKMKSVFKNDNPYGTLHETLSGVAVDIQAKQASEVPV